MRTPSGVVALLLLGGCLLAAASPGRADDLSGSSWAGRWESDSTGHTGPLKATLRQTDACHYRVVFRGRFRKVIPFVYVTTLTVTGREGDKVCLAGESRLPLFGTFRMEAEVSACDFVATFSAAGDQGTFVMSRR